ncbi:MAG: hypothetical protein K0S47_3585 [Herbinix sp.]|nr:hypothetical protein [Herbinix sp.]
MKKKKSLIIFGLCICVVFLIVFKLNQLSLKQPIYYRYLVEHYLPSIADSVYETSTINLIYITNAWDDNQITNVTFDEHPELTATVYGSQSKQYGIYKVVNVVLFFEWNQNVVDALPKVAKINTIQVTYSNRQSHTVDIGKWYLYSGESAENLLEPVDCLPLYDSERFQTYEASLDLFIKGFSPTTLECIEDADIIEALSFTYGNYDLLQPSEPIMVRDKSQIEFKMKIKNSKMNRLISYDSYYDYYEIEPQIELSDEFNHQYFVTIANPYTTLQFKNYKDVKKYLQRRR